MLRIISSTGTFGPGQSPSVNYPLATGSSFAVPALADLTGDGRADLLVLLADGSVRLYPNSGSASAPFSDALFEDDVLPENVPGSTGCARVRG